MKISVNIKVRNPEWYWTPEELLESKEAGSLSREDFEAINGDKIKKHDEFVDFEYKFEVINYTTNPKTTFDLSIFTSESEEYVNPTEHILKLENVTIVEFIGKTEKSLVVVSNDLIHQFIGASKGNDGRIYWYFYLKENTPYKRLCDNIWISNEIFTKQCGNLVLEANRDLFFSFDNKNLMDKNLKMREHGYGK